MKRILLLLAVGSILSTHLVSAQSNEKLKQKEATVDSKKSSDLWQKRLATLRYDGLPLAEVAKHLGDQFPEINFVVAPDDTETQVNVDLRSVTLDDIFTAMNLASKGRIQADKINDRMVHFKLVESAPQQPPQKRQCVAFSISRYLSGKSDKEMQEAIRDLYEAIDQCWEMLKRANPTDSNFQRPDFSLHLKTKLLLVVGVPEQLQVVQQVVSQLDGGEGGAIDPTTGLPVVTANPFTSPVAASVSPAPLVTKIIHLKYASPVEIASVVQAVVRDNPRSKVIADVRTSQVVVSATEEELKAIEKLVKTLDVPGKETTSSSTNKPPSPK